MQVFVSDGLLDVLYIHMWGLLVGIPDQIPGAAVGTSRHTDKGVQLDAGGAARTSRRSKGARPTTCKPFSALFHVVDIYLSTSVPASLTVRSSDNPPFGVLFAVCPDVDCEESVRMRSVWPNGCSTDLAQ